MKKVGRKQQFTARDVVDQAIALGLESFTLAEVARQLGVTQAALYRVFSSREEIVLAALEQIAETIAFPASGASWSETLQLWADECWRICAENPEVTSVLYSLPEAYTTVQTVFDRYVEAVTRDGISVGQAVFAVDLVGDTVMASYQGVELMAQRDEEGVAGFERARAHASKDMAMFPDESWAGRTWVDRKITFIIRGLAQYWPSVFDDDVRVGAGD